MFSLTFLTFVLVLLDSAISKSTLSTPPRVTVANGTYEGKYVSSYNQDLFLGIPYAQPPIGDLRLRNPQSLNTTFGVKKVVDYSASCIGYGVSFRKPSARIKK
jgi:carboxylesterase type B